MSYSETLGSANRVDEGDRQEDNPSSKVKGKERDGTMSDPGRSTKPKGKERGEVSDDVEVSSPTIAGTSDFTDLCRR